MNEKVIRKLNFYNYNYKYKKSENKIILKEYFGNIIIKCQRETFIIEKRFNFSNYALYAFLFLFAYLLFADGTNDHEIKYALIIIYLILHDFFSRLMLEVRKSKLQTMLGEIYEL